MYDAKLYGESELVNMCIYVCVCVCVRERERERESLCVDMFSLI